ncbi:cilia- and flagella-associated protein 57-like, partial [Limulus polyphemus]|uniref:Cilia- and flagella-associated protein 57-like n=1 Tax=Limulus polyphemus TaxID=6850 RepID=A0ABM1RW59_LIMPO
ATQIQELKHEVEHLQLENEYQLRLKAMNHSLKMKENTDKHKQEIEDLKAKIGHLTEEETSYKQKLLREYERYEELQKQSQLMQDSYEQQIQEMETTHQKAVQELVDYYEHSLTERETKLEQAKDEAQLKQREEEELRKLIEEEADDEIVQLRTNYERQLRQEKETNMQLLGDNSILKKKFTSQQRDVEEHKNEIQRQHAEQQKLQGIIKNLDKDIHSLKREVQERDETIQDKEKRIYDLKKKNQELEKFKFVLDFKIQELRRQVEPREEEICNMRIQIQDMENELAKFHRTNTHLELNISELQQKLKVTEKDLKNEKLKVHNLDLSLDRFRTELHACAGLLQDPKKLKESVKTLYQKHVQDVQTDRSAEDFDLHAEFSRQRDHLERSLASLRRKLLKDTSIHRTEYTKVMQ